MTKLKLLYSSAIAASLAIIFAVGVTIAAEFSPMLKEWLKSISGHHWTTKSIFTMAVYFISLIVCYVFPHTVSTRRIRLSLIALCIVALLGTVALFGFFTWHYFEA